jgi:acyl-coenzyme A thioesterase PaaI-like protein
LTYPEPPPGFAPLPSRSPFVNRSGQFFSKTDEDGRVIVGTWVGPEQSNAENVAHGGFLLAFADFALTVVGMCVTLSLTGDFMRPAPLGAWLEAKVMIRKQSAHLLFADTLIETDGEPILRVTGVFKPFVRR